MTDGPRITIPDLSLVLLMGPAGSGKTTFANRHFKPTEILSIEQARAMVADDERDQAALDDAFASMSYLAMRRLAAGRTTVIDDRHLAQGTREMLIGLAQEHHVIPVAVVFHMPESVLLERNRSRGRDGVPAEILMQQTRAFRQMLPGLGREGFRHIYEILSPQEAEAAEVRRQPLWNRRVDDHGPFDIVGDVHGCYDELRRLLQRLGYLVFRDGDSSTARHSLEHPTGRKLVFLGDLAGYGPNVAGVLRLVMDAVDSGMALAVPGDHDVRMAEWLQGKRHRYPDAHLSLTGESFRSEALGFLSSTVSHYVLDDGKLGVAHAGMREALQGRGSVQVRQFAVYGERLQDNDAPPAEPSWPSEYHGSAMVVYGHTPVRRPAWVNRTMNIDTGCVFGGQLTALRYPERELVAVDALRAWISPLAQIECCSR